MHTLYTPIPYICCIYRICLSPFLTLIFPAAQKFICLCRARLLYESPCPVTLPSVRLMRPLPHTWFYVHSFLSGHFWPLHSLSLSYALFIFGSFGYLANSIIFYELKQKTSFFSILNLYLAIFVCLNSQISVIIKARVGKLSMSIAIYHQLLVFILNFSCHTYRLRKLIIYIFKATY